MIEGSRIGRGLGMEEGVRCVADAENGPQPKSPLSQVSNPLEKMRPKSLFRILFRCRFFLLAFGFLPTWVRVVFLHGVGNDFGLRA